MSARSRRVFEEGFILTLAAAARGFAVVPTDGSATPTTSPRVVSGRGVPTLVLPVSSVYIRIDAPDDDTWLYRATDSAGTWVAALGAEVAEALATLAATTSGNGASLIGIYDAAALLTATNVEGALAEIIAKIVAIGAENADVTIPVDLATRTDVSGTWTLTRTGTAAYQLRRTAGASVQVCALRSSPRSRTTASKGFKLTGARLVYKVSTADVNDVTVSAAFTVAPATGAAVAAATSLGTVTYDAAHDTAAERKAQGDHTMVVTFGTPVYLTNDPLHLEILVVVDGTASGVLDILGLELLGSETIVDLA